MRAAMTDPTTTHCVGDEPLPGYRLVAPLGRGGFGEVWRCVAPGGLQKAIKFVAEDAAARAEGRTPLKTEYEAFQRVKGIRHPFLLQLERVELIDGELLMVMELADSSLLNRFHDCRAAGRSGIPRTELLSYMVDAAEALDVLSTQHQLQHLDVKPANLFLLGGHVKVGDYGLVAHFERGGPDAGRLGRGLTPKYVAPEVLVNQVDPRSDQYTLALVYLELLTGSYPYDGTTAQQLLHQHAHTTPDLIAAPDGDRAPLRRALSKRPDERYPTCLEFVKALLTHHAVGPADTQPIRPPAARTLPASRVAPVLEATVPVGGDLASLGATLNTVPAGLGLYGSATRLPTPPVGPGGDLQRAFPGYRLAAELEHGPRGKVVRATDPAGRPFRVRTVDLGHGNAGDIEGLLRSVLSSHPNVHQGVSVPHPRCVAFAVPDDLTTLADRHRDLAAAGAAFDRPELLALLAAVAAALDDLHDRTGFAHGLLNPAAVVAQAGKVGLTGFGVGELLRRTRPELDWIARDPYAAPEALQGQAAPASDQYSLAFLYLEARHAWTPAPRRPGSSADHGVNFGPLRDDELPAIRKALAARPADRHATCAAFVAALGVAPAPAGPRALEELRVVESLARLGGRPAPWPRPAAPAALVEAILRLAPAPALTLHLTRQPDHRWSCRVPVLVTADKLRAKLDQFRDENGLTVLTVGPDALVYWKPAGLGKTGAELTVELPAGTGWDAGELTVHARLLGGHDSGSKELPPALEELLDRFRRAAHPTADRRRAPRRRAIVPVTLTPIDDELRLGEPLAALCRDVSAGGFGCTADGPGVTGHLFATFPGNPETAPWAILCEVARSGRDPQTGQTVLGVRFLG